MSTNAVSSNPLAPSWLTVPADANALADGVWSRGAVRATSGALQIAGADAVALAEEYGTPLYVLDEADALGRAGFGGALQLRAAEPVIG